MKKLLGILLTAVMVCTSMGVLAAGTEETDPNVILYTGFEEGGLNDNGFIEGNSNNSGKYWALEESGAYAGNRCLKVAFYSDDGSYRVQVNRLAIEPANAVYKLSFWFKYGVYTAGNMFAPRIVIQDGTNKSSAINMLCSVKENGDIIPTCNVNEWTYYEVYFAVTEATTHLTIQLRNAGTKKAQDAFYYDEFKLEKVDDADFLFAEGDATNAGFAVSDLTSEQFGATSGNNFAKATEMTLGNETVTMYPFALTAKPKTTATGIVRTISHYTPKSAADKAIMLVGIYQNDNEGTPILKNVSVKPYDYTANSGKLGSGVNYYDVDMTNYEGCYVKTFMINNLTELDSISEIATLPAAQ